MKNLKRIQAARGAWSGWVGLRLGLCAAALVLAAACGHSFYSPVRLSDADVLRIALEIGRCELAAERWMTDMGGLRPLSAKGEFTQSHMPNFECQLMYRRGTEGMWANWHGPYLSSFIFREYWPRTTFACRQGGQEYQLDAVGEEQPQRWILELSICDVSEAQWQQLKKLLEPGIVAPENDPHKSGRVHWRPDVLSILVAYEP